MEPALAAESPFDAAAASRDAGDMLAGLRLLEAGPLSVRAS